MKILFVLENYYPHIGVVETLFKNLAEALSKENHEVFILTTLKNDGDERLEKNGNIIVHRKKYSNRYFFTFFAFFAAFRLSKSCDLIHTTSYNAAMPAWLAGKLRNKKIIITFHEVWGDLWFQLPFMSKFGARLHHLFEQILLRLHFYKFVGVSQYTQDALIDNGVDPKQTTMIYNGIDYAEFSQDKHQPDSDQFTFTFFGRLGMSKGIEIYLQAIEVLIKSNVEAHFKLIIPTQPAPFLKEIQNIIDQLGIRENLIIKHNLLFTELKKEIAQSSAIVIPSYSEGFCFAAIESMAIGTPIISSSKGALAEVISGKYIEMEALNSNALVRAMHKALRNDWQETPFKKFKLKDTVDNYLSLYQTIFKDK